MASYDGEVEGFMTLWGHCRRGVEDEKSEGEKY
jgi:hypothetical protein